MTLSVQVVNMEQRTDDWAAIDSELEAKVRLHPAISPPLPPPASAKNVPAVAPKPRPFLYAIPF